MSDFSEDFLSSGIHDYLLAVADSLHDTQLRLSQMTLPAQAGQPTIAYHLPRLDFELKLLLDVSQKTEDDGKPGKLQLNARPSNANHPNAQGTSIEEISTIKGSFVAVPLEAGSPPAIVRTALERKSSRELGIIVAVRSAAGEVLHGVDVQFNIDPDQSRALNQVEGVRAARSGNAPYELRSGTYLLNGKVTTQEDGRAVNTLVVDKQESVGAHIVIIIDVVGETQTIVFRVDQEA